ncbi:MAG: T9SS type A sorting domain-containing protein [Bacteroidia bacterium]|nr:T9SS type A sorting domain-containing protein [Bacteroidia bacterium]
MAVKEMMFIMLDSSGNVVWAKQGKTDSVSYAFHIYAEKEPKTLFFLHNKSVLDSTILIDSKSYSAIKGVSFFSKIDTVKKFKSNTVTNSIYSKFGRTILIDSFGNKLLASSYLSPFSVNGTQYKSSGGTDIALFNYDKHNTLKWVRTIGGAGNEGVYYIEKDSISNIYIAGYFSGKVKIHFDSKDSTHNKSEKKYKFYQEENTSLGNETAPLLTKCNDFFAYPNPTHSHLTIEASGYNCVKNSDLKITILDVAGRKFHSEDLYAHTTSKLSFDIEAYPKGAYIIEMVDKSTGQSYRFKFIKL